MNARYLKMSSALFFLSLVLSLVPRGLAQISEPQSPQLGVKTEVVCAVPEGLTETGSSGALCAVSPDGKHFLEVIAPDVIVDGKHYPADGLYGAPAFSADSKHFIFLVLHGNNWAVNIDGKLGPPFFTAGRIDFSSDGKHYAYPISNGQSWAIVIDGNAGPWGNYYITMPVYSPDSRHLVYGVAKVVTTGNQPAIVCHEVYDGKELGSYHGTPGDDFGVNLITNQISGLSNNFPIGKSGFYFSPDSNHLAFTVNENGRHVVYDGKVGPAFRASTDPAFSADSKHMWYMMAGPGQVAIDGNLSAVYSDAEFLTVTADGTHYAFAAAKSDNLAYIIRDGVESHPFLGLKAFYPLDSDLTNNTHIHETLHLSADGSILIYVLGKDNNNVAAVVNGQESKEYSKIDCIGLSPDGKHFAYTGYLFDGEVELVRDGNVVDRAHGGPMLSESLISGIGAVCLCYSPDSSRLAYDRGDSSGGYLVVDSDKYAADPYVYEPTFSPDSKHFAFITGRHGNMRVVIDGKPGPIFFEITDLTFSPDGLHWAYKAVSRSEDNNTEKSSIVVDNKLNGPELDFPVLPHWNTPKSETSGQDRLKFNGDNSLQYLAVKGTQLVRVTYTLAN